MHQTNDLRSIDLNLLVVLEALLTERHVSRAAERLAMTQPAVSHALARLRELLDDPLLVRQGNAMLPTARAQALARPLADVLGQVRDLVLPGGFDPARSQRRFRVGVSDYGSAVVLPGVLRRLRSTAPGMTLEAMHYPRLEILRRVGDGTLDAGMVVAPMLPEDLQGELLLREHFVCVTDRANIDDADTCDLQRYLAAPHLHISIQGMHHSHVDEALRAQGLSRRIVAIAPHFMVATSLLPGTDLMLTVAARAVNTARLDPHLACFTPPLAVPSFDVMLVSRRDSDNDPALAWLREVCRGAVMPRAGQA